MPVIENEFLRVDISTKGAELQSIIHKANGIEYLWSGDENYWGKKSPVLFPVVGGLKNGSYTHNGHSYTMGRHGFARDRIFSVIQATNSNICFELTADAETLKIYPFEFCFRIAYALHLNSLSCTYNVVNTGNTRMYFSVGAHPAFNVPLTDNTRFSDWHLAFSNNENANRWPLSSDGLLQLQPEAFLQHTQILPLQKELFHTDALVFKALQSATIALQSPLTPHGLKLHAEGFPYYGIWSAKNADFVCLEPWCGIADSVNSSGNLKDKEGIQQLEPAAAFSRTWRIECF
jgi:galactose mutarotase-like enzyme